MENRESVILGIDYSNEYTQVSYFASDMDKPVSVSTIIEEHKYIIPTVVCQKLDSDEWYIGDEAIHRASLNEGYLIKDISNGLINGSVCVIEGVKYTYSQIFIKFFETLIRMVKELSNNQKIASIIFTMDSADKSFTDIIKNILYETGFKKEQIKLISHVESFAFYLLNQPKSLWLNDVVLFDFSRIHFKYYRFSVNRRKLPNIVTVDEEDLSEVINSKFINSDEGMNIADVKFSEIIEEKINRNIVSTVYLLGIGFTRQWFDSSISLLCSKRKVFQGQNLFSLGACYSLYPKEINLKEYLLLCEGRTLVNISLIIDYKGQSRQLMLSKAGENWYESGAKIECILDDIRTIKLIITYPETKITKSISIELEGFPYRPNKTTRVELKIVYQSSKQFLIVIKDKGFGELFKASDKVIQKTIDIDHF